MFTLIRWFFTIFGVVSFIFWLGLGYGWMTDAYGVKTGTTAIVKMFRASATTESKAPVPPVETRESGEVEEVEKNSPSVTAEQQAVLDSVGIDADAIPTSLTTAQQQCIEEKIGKERAAAIAAGATPTAVEVFAGASCL